MLKVAGGQGIREHGGGADIGVVGTCGDGSLKLLQAVGVGNDLLEGALAGVGAGGSVHTSLPVAVAVAVAVLACACACGSDVCKHKLSRERNFTNTNYLQQ